LYAITESRVVGARSRDFAEHKQPVRAVISDNRNGSAWAHAALVAETADIAYVAALTAAFTGTEALRSFRRPSTSERFFH